MKLVYAMLFSTVLASPLLAKNHEGKGMGWMVKRMTHEVERMNKDIAKHQKWMKHHPDMDALKKIVEAEMALVKEKEEFLAHMEAMAPVGGDMMHHEAPHHDAPPHHDMNNAAHPE